jgi:integrase
MSVFYDDCQRSWIYDFWKDGQRFKRRARNPDGTSASSRRQAQEAENRARVAAATALRGRAISNPGDFTLAEAVVVRAAEVEGYSSIDGVTAALSELLRFFGPACAVGDAAARAGAFRVHVAKMTRKIWIGGPGTHADRADPKNWRDTGAILSASRRNKYLDELRIVLKIAHKTKAPGTDRPHLADVPEIKPFDEPKRDPTPVPLYVMAAIETDPHAPDHLWKAAALVRLIGFRRDEVFSATVDWIDWESGGVRIPAAFTKSDRDEFLPANEEARELLAWLAADAIDRAKSPPMSAGKRDDARHLIVYRRPGRGGDGKPFAARPMKNARKAWKTALKRAGAPSYRFHDVRATFVTQVAHVAPSAVTQDLARHKDAATTARYTKVADEAKRAAVEAMRGTADVSGPGKFSMESPTAKSHRISLRRVK